MRDHSLKSKVVVITGASSGIGRSGALRFAREGAKVVLAARGRKSLEETAREVERLGGCALAVPTDMAREEDVENLARRAEEAFGHIDIWINNAVVTAFGRLDQIPPDAIRRIIEVNLIGYLFGARTAISRFRRQRRGILINVSSPVGKRGEPMTSPYATTRSGVVGLSQSLRMELTDFPDIHVCTLMLASMDTPLFQHAGNYSGVEVKPLNPVYSPEMGGKAMVKLAKRPKREMVAGPVGWLMLLLPNIAPGVFEKVAGPQIIKDHFYHDRQTAPKTGNLFQPLEELNDVSGGWKHSNFMAVPYLRYASYGALGLALGVGLWAGGKRLTRGA